MPRKYCPASIYFKCKKGYTIETVYHWTRSAFLVIINLWLIVSTWQTYSVIRKYSERSLFKKELRNIFILYWSFVVSYSAWLVCYIIEQPIEYGTS